jgi:hypothetical protein
MFSGEGKALRAGPASLTLEALGRWASIVVAAGDHLRLPGFIAAGHVFGRT